MAIDTGHRLPCRYHDGETEVHEDKRGKWYLNCRHCGIFKFQTKAGEQLVRDMVENLQSDDVKFANLAAELTNNPDLEVVTTEDVINPAPAPRKSLFKRRRK